jgi:hypothetical protein
VRSSSRPCGHSGFDSGCGARRKPRRKNGEKKQLSSLLARLAGDGCLKMSNNAAERAVRLITLGRKNAPVPAPEDHLHAHRIRQTPMSNSTE